jgi:hypothetical protein
MSKILTLEKIENEMASVTSPGRLAELRVMLSAKYARATNEYEKVLLAKPAIWNELRKTVKSDTRAEREWEATELGIEERHWKFQIKKIDHMMTAIKTLIDVRTNESRNLY